MNQRAALTANAVCYGQAALICFSIAVLLYVAVVILPFGPMAVAQVASLGVAWWLVGCGLVPLAGYWVWRRVQLDRAN
jgi:hypothetical protein